MTLRTGAGVSGGNRASQSLTSTGTRTGPPLVRPLRRCSLTALARSRAGAMPGPTSKTQSVASAACALAAPGQTLATASASTWVTNLASRRTLSSAFLNRPRFGFDATAMSKPGAANGSARLSTSPIASRRRDRLALRTKSIPAAAGRRACPVGSTGGGGGGGGAAAPSGVGRGGGGRRGGRVWRRRGRGRRGGRPRRTPAARQLLVVPAAQFRIHQDPVGLRQIRRDARRHFLELLSQVLDLVGVIAGNLPPERLLDFVGRRVARHRQHVVVVLQRPVFLNSATLLAG